MVELQIGSSRKVRLPMTSKLGDEHDSVRLQSGKNKWDKVAAQFESQGYLNGLPIRLKSTWEDSEMVLPCSLLFYEPISLGHQYFDPVGRSGKAWVSKGHGENEIWLKTTRCDGIFAKIKDVDPRLELEKITESVAKEVFDFLNRRPVLDRLHFN